MPKKSAATSKDLTFEELEAAIDEHVQAAAEKQTAKEAPEVSEEPEVVASSLAEDVPLISQEKEPEPVSVSVTKSEPESSAQSESDAEAETSIPIAIKKSTSAQAPIVKPEVSAVASPATRDSGGKGVIDATLRSPRSKKVIQPISPGVEVQEPKPSVAAIEPESESTAEEFPPAPPPEKAPAESPMSVTSPSDENLFAPESSAETPANIAPTVKEAGEPTKPAERSNSQKQTASINDILPSAQTQPKSAPETPRLAGDDAKETVSTTAGDVVMVSAKDAGMSPAMPKEPKPNTKPEEAIIEEDAQQNPKIFDTKEYNLPIKASRRHRKHSVPPVLGVFIILLVFLAVGLAFIKFEIIDIGVDLPF